MKDEMNAFLTRCRALALDVEGGKRSEKFNKTSYVVKLHDAENSKGVFYSEFNKDDKSAIITEVSFESSKEGWNEYISFLWMIGNHIPEKSDLYVDGDVSWDKGLYIGDGGRNKWKIESVAPYTPICDYLGFNNLGCTVVFRKIGEFTPMSKISK